MKPSSLEKANETIKIVREVFQSDQFIPLHEPRFIGREKEYLGKCIDSTFVSYLGQFVTDLEAKITAFTGARYCITTANGTAALHAALLGAAFKRTRKSSPNPLRSSQRWLRSNTVTQVARS